MSNYLEVSDEFRRNILSITPGGCTLEVTMIDNKIRSYDKIKNFEAYVARMNTERVKSILIKETGTLIWKRD